MLLKLITFISALIFCFKSFSSRYDVIFSLCSTTQGNGYNYSSTLSWLATSINEAYLRGENYKQNNPNRKIGYTLNCFGGASSGSGVSAIYDGFLTNSNLQNNESIEKIVGNRLSGERILSMEEVDRISKGLTFLSLGADFDKFTGLSTYARIIGKNVVGRIRNQLPENELDNMWVESFDAKISTVDFATHILFGQYVPWRIIDQEIEFGKGVLADIKIDDLLTNEAKEIAKSMDRIYNLPKIQDFKLLENSDFQKDLKVIDRASHRLAKFARREVKDLNKSIYSEKGFSARDYLLRRGHEIVPQLDKLKKNTPLAEVLSLKPSKDFLTMTNAIMFDDMNGLIKNGKNFQYDEMRTLVFVTKETAESILNSKEYHNYLDKNQNITPEHGKLSDWSRYIIAVVDEKTSNRYTQVNASIREPVLLNELYGKLAGDKFRITHLYDPREDGDKSFKLKSMTDPVMNKKVVFVLGGFPYREIIAMITHILHIDRVKKLEDSEITDKVIKIHNLFGSYIGPRNRDTTFTAKQVTSPLLNKNLKSGERSEESLIKYEEWVTAFNDIQTKLEGEGFKITRTDYHWGSAVLPAMLTGKSRDLSLKARNFTEKSMSEQLDDSPFRDEPQTFEKNMISKENILNIGIRNLKSILK